MLFAFPALLAIGAAALVVPVLLHLRQEKNRRRIVFPALAFVPVNARPTRGRRSIRDWPLLVARLMAIVLLAAALSGPTLDLASRPPDTETPAQTALILIVDASASMRGGDTWARGLEVARDRLRQETPSLAALIVARANPETLETWAPAKKIADRLDTLEPSFESASLTGALRAALTLTRSVPQRTTPRIAIISDFQRSAITGLERLALPPDLKVDLHPIGPTPQPLSNAAILNLREIRGPTTLAEVKLRNDSAAAVRLPVTLEIDGKAAAPQAWVEIGPRAEATTRIAMPKLDPGVHRMEAKIVGNDWLAADNALAALSMVSRPLHVLTVEPHLDLRPHLQSTLFLTHALAPGSAGSSTGRAENARFSLERIAPGQLAAALRQSPRPDVVVAPSLGAVPVDAIEELAKFVEAGGGLLQFAPPDPRAAALALRRGGLDPVRFLEPEDTAALGFLSTGWQIDAPDASPLAPLFRHSRAHQLRPPAFRERYRLAPLPHAEVWATFNDGTIPAIVRSAYGMGNVVLINAPPDTTTADWPKHPSFVPLVHRLVALAAAPRHPSSTDGAEAASLVIGSSAPMTLGQPNAEVTIFGPDGHRSQHTLDAGGTLSPSRQTFDRPGFYRIEGGSAPWIAARIPDSESELEFAAASEIDAQLLKNAAAASPAADDPASPPQPSPRLNLTPLLLGLLFVILTAELFMAAMIRSYPGTASP
jgi:hypothetical protein